MNCDKKFLFTLRLETGGYALGLLHSGASVAVLVLYLNHLQRFSHVPVWWVLVLGVFWVFHFVASVMLLIGTAKRKSSFLIPFIILYTIIFTIVATFAAFCVLEIIATNPRSEHKKVNTQQNISTLEMKRKMKEFKQNSVFNLKMEKKDHILLIVVVTIICLLCVYILSCVCALYDKLKEYPKEHKSLPILGNIVYGAVKKSESSES
ncbi:hypothetical protein ACKWTF_014572 [Chironomus riparius]